MKSVSIEYPFGDNAPHATLYYGIDVIEGLKLLPDKSIQTVCTSPPYWSLRDYGTEGQLGLEKTPQEYVQRLVNVFREIRRVLRDDGTVWLNLGDSYNSGRDGGHPGGKNSGFQKVDSRYQNRSGANAPGLKPKDLVGIPWRLAFALQEDGWYLRSDIIWSKRVVMPSSVKDRPTKSHEYVFLLTKREKYFYDQESIREISLEGSGGRNKRSVWEINPKPYKGAHFATWPPDLVKPMIQAGTSECGACPQCGSPWKRVVTKGDVDKKHQKACGADKSGEYHGEAIKDYQGALAENPSDVKRRILAGLRQRSFHWEPTCECKENPTSRSIVLDPFSGSATTGMVALQEGRDYIGIDLNESYLPLAEARLLYRPAPEESEEVEDSVLDMLD